jgi:hypothetical protein
LESVYLPICKVDNVRHAYLGLEGTILLFGQRQAATDSELQIPVELVTISEVARFKGRRLIAALLCLLLPIMLFGLAYGVVFGVRGTQDVEVTAGFVILTCAFLCVLLVGLVVFSVLLVLFFCKVRTVRLSINPAPPERSGDGSEADSAGPGRRPADNTIEFYKHRKQAVEIDDFLAQIRQRQALVNESLAAPAKRPVGFTKEHSVMPKLAAFLWLSVLPAVITGKPSLLILPLGVLAWFAYQQVQYRRQPREYRQAVRSYLRGDLDGAIEALQGLRGRLADYIPAYFFLAEVFTRAGRFDEALDLAAILADDYPDVARQMQDDIWLFKRIHQRRDPALGAL